MEHMSCARHGAELCGHMLECGHLCPQPHVNRQGTVHTGTQDDDTSVTQDSLEERRLKGCSAVCVRVCV